MRLLFFCLLLCSFWACRTASDSPAAELRPTPDGKAYYGGIFQLNEEEFFRSLYPPNIGDAIGHRIANQIYEGLVRPDQGDLHIVPVLASRWNISPDGKTYTFYLRRGAKFHDDPCFPDGKGREVTAQDFKFCFDRLCTFSADNKGFNFFKERIEGAVEHYEKTQSGQTVAGGVRGVQALNDSTLEIRLVQPFPNFLYLLSMQYGFVYPHEMVEKYTAADLRLKAVGTGPFYLKNVRENEALILLKNESYWQQDSAGNKLPYLDGLRISFVNDKMAELVKL